MITPAWTLPRDVPVIALLFSAESFRAFLRDLRPFCSCISQLDNLTSESSRVGVMMSTGKIHIKAGELCPMEITVFAKTQTVGVYNSPSRVWWWRQWLRLVLLHLAQTTSGIRMKSMPDVSYSVGLYRMSFDWMLASAAAHFQNLTLTFMPINYPNNFPGSCYAWSSSPFARWTFG